MQKFIYRFVCFAFISYSFAFAQQKTVAGKKNFQVKFKKNILNFTHIQEADTVGINDFLNCQPTVFFSDNGGFVAGTNGFGDLEKSQFYQISGQTTVSEILIWFGGKTVAANPGNVTATIYSNSEAGTPLQLLGTSAVSMADIDTSGFLTSFIFNPLVDVDTGFFAGIRMSTVAGDSVGLVSTDDGCTAVTNSWEQWNDSTWHTIESSWQNDTGGPLKIDFAVFPVLQTNPTAVTGKKQLPAGFALQQNFPNPFNPSTTITYMTSQNTWVTLKIFNLTGQEIRTLVNEFQTTGSRTVKWDGVKNNGTSAASGMYVYKLNAGNVTESRRMLLLK